MNQPRVNISLDEPSRAYRPGDVLTGQFTLDDAGSTDVRSIEISVLWHTEGKGDEDMSVHFFQRAQPRDGESLENGQPHRFSTILPNSPLSYSGFIVKICWCVRVRVFLAQGKELTLEVPFRVGTVPHPEQVST